MRIPNNIVHHQEVGPNLYEPAKTCMSNCHEKYYVGHKPVNGFENQYDP